MTRKRALIVDDSRTAQVRLKRMLNRYDLEVDTALSAEDALSYLAYKLPDVVFMDHLMKGMDGFEAVKIIKSNPDTAMIPIIMYTSKSGDVYLGQARALGAIDVLSKDEIEPSDLDKVLNQLNIVPKSAAEQAQAATQTEAAAEAKQPVKKAPEQKPATNPATPAKAPAKVVVQQAAQASLDSLRGQIAKLMDFHITKVRHDIIDSSKLLMRRLSRELQEISTNHKSLSNKIEFIPVTIEAEQNRKHISTRWWLLVPILVLVLFAIVSFHQLSLMNEQFAVLKEEYVSLSEFIKRDYQKLNRERASLQQAMAGDDRQADAHGLLETITWAFNMNGQYEFGKSALGDEQMGVVNELVSRLEAADFVGTITIDVHIGDFCVTTNSIGELILPKSDTPISECDLLSNQSYGFSVDDQMSLSFISFLSTSPMLREGSIQIETNSYGVDEPLQAYPDISNIRTIGDWNKVAAVNNRIEVAIHSQN